MRFFSSPTLLPQSALWIPHAFAFACGLKCSSRSVLLVCDLGKEHSPFPPSSCKTSTCSAASDATFSLSVILSKVIVASLDSKVEVDDSMQLTMRRELDDYQSRDERWRLSSVQGAPAPSFWVT